MLRMLQSLAVTLLGILLVVGITMLALATSAVFFIVKIVLMVGLVGGFLVYLIKDYFGYSKETSKQ